jgi:NAD(P)H-hydrate epimerase
LVLTPHPGEMARITGQKVSEIENNRIETARSFAREHQLVLVLKGWRTLIANPDGKIWVNSTGNPGLAKGGSGDVLTGLVAGLMAQFPDAILDAVRAAVYLHGMAADLVLEGQTMQTMLATDLLPKLSTALLLTTAPTAQQIFGVEGDFTLIQRGFEAR